MFAYCRCNPVNRVDHIGSEDEEATSEKNIENMMKFFGVTSEEDLPELEDNCMVFIENAKSISLGFVTFVYGTTIVMDNEKYCIFTFNGISKSKGAISLPFDGSITKGYVYNVGTPDDYCGLFFGASANYIVDAAGGAVAPNGVYAKIITGASLTASLGGSITYYSKSSKKWVYGKADIHYLPNPFSNQPDICI